MGRRISGRFLRNSFLRSFFRRNSFRRSLFPQSSFQRSLLFSLCSLYRMVMVGTKWEESARVEMLFSWCCRWFFPFTRPAVHELERNVTTAEHTATMRYLMNAFMFWLISILPPFSFVSRRRFPVRDSKDSLQGLESGLTNFGLNSASQLEKNIFPVRKVIFQRFLNHDAKIRHSSYPVVRCRAMPCDAGTFSLKFPKILPFSCCSVKCLILPFSLL